MRISVASESCVIDIIEVKGHEQQVPSLECDAYAFAETVSADTHAVKTRVAAADDGGLPQAFEDSMFRKSRPRPTVCRTVDNF